MLLPSVDPYEAGRLRLAGTIQPEPADRAESDAGGLFELAAPEIGLWRVRVEKPGHLPRVFELRPLVEAVALPAVELEPAAELAVRVRGGETSEVTVAAEPATAGAHSQPWPRRRVPAEGWKAPAAVAVADAGGIARLPLGGGEWRLEVRAAGRAPARREILGTARPASRPRRCPASRSPRARASSTSAPWS